MSVSPLSSSPLVRLLAESAPMSVDVSRADFAQRLSHWLGAVDAVQLHARLHAHKPALGPVEPPPSRGAPVHQPPHALESLWAHVQRVQVTLAAAVCAPVPDADGDEFAPYLRHCQALQRQMGLTIAALRAQVRQVLAQVPGPLCQLAELDAVWQQLLADRAEQQLATVPTWLKQRFAHLQTVGELARYAPEQQTVLMAELTVRLLPVVGLVEAFAQAHGTPEPR